MSFFSFGSEGRGSGGDESTERIAWLGLIVLIVVASSVVAGAVVATAERAAALRDQGAVNQYTERVRFYDELLTSTARLAASTGDDEVLRRYWTAVAEFDAALAELMRLSHDEDARNAVAGMLDSTEVLLSIEARALRLSRQGRGPEAERLLATPRYEREKAIYAAAVGQALDVTEAAAADRVSRADAYRLLVLGLAILGVVAVIALGFLYARRNRELRMDLSGRSRELAQSLQVLAAISDNSTDALYVKDPEGRYLLMNPAGAAMTGRRPEDFVGRTDDQVLEPETLELAREADRQVAEAERPTEQVQTVPLGGEDRTFVSLRGPLRDADGSYRGLFGISRDITDQHRRSTFAQVQHEVTRVLVEAPEPARVAELVLPKLVDAPDILWAAHWAPPEDGEEYVCTTVSAGEEVESGFAPGDRRRFDTNVEERYGLIWLDDNEGWSEALVSLPPDGVLLLACKPAVKGNHDLENVIESVTLQISHYLERSRLAREAERAKDEFFGLVSHELRTPLTSIIGFAELLGEVQGERLDDQGRHYLEVIERNARRELRLVQDLLLIVRVEGARFSLARDEADLATVVRESCEALRPQAEAKGVSLEVELADLGRAWIDSGRLGQAVDNLLTNAIKFSPAGGSVSVVLRPASGGAEIEVADDGIGVSPEEVEHLFDRLFRASTALENQIPGTGLGLTIVKAVAEAHGGSVAVSSVEGEGTTFTIELPLQRRPPADDGEVRDEANARHAGGLSR